MNNNKKGNRIDKGEQDERSPLSLAISRVLLCAGEKAELILMALKCDRHQRS